VIHDVAIVGSGFAGSVLARAAARRGLRVLLLDKATHPRFALGESSTPLAAASLERLASRHDLPDLYDLAAHGRWLAALPHLRRGLKRGFTFFHHPRGRRPYLPTPDDRMLVAASPDDAVADAHWLRADVDHHLAVRAGREGADLREGVELSGIDRHRGGFRLTGRDASGSAFRAQARWLVDASGPSAAVARSLGARDAAVDLPQRGLVFAHVGSLPSFASQLEVPLPPGPFPDEAAAVHHLMSGGWLYRLAFDHGPSSCGLILRSTSWAEGPDPARDPCAALRWQVERRAPSLARQLAEATPHTPWRWTPALGHRLDRAAGSGWLALPHAFAFFDPLFSTGIAWSLRAVERALDVVEGERSGAQYGRLLAAEAERIEALIRLSWSTLETPRRFRAVALLYFAAVSFQESRERLLDPPSPTAFAWEGFLGVGDPVVDAWFREAEVRLAQDPDGFPGWVATAIEPRNVAGLADPGKHGLYAVDLEDLVRAAAKLGLSPAEVRRRIGRLRRALRRPSRTASG
jgi:FADH2 O2-dependent halogenase